MTSTVDRVPPFSNAPSAIKQHYIGTSKRRLPESLLTVLPNVQAAAFLTAAWEALAARLGRPAGALPVVFEDVALLQAVPLKAGGAATLRVSLDARQRFQVKTLQNPVF